MKKIILFALIQILTFKVFAQQIILPGDALINKSLLKFGITTMDYSIHSKGNIRLVGNYEIAIKYDNKTLEVYTTLSNKDKTFPKLKHIVSDANSFKPISLELLTIESKLELKFSDKITGFQQERSSKTKTTINDKMKDGYFDINTFPYILPALPLTEGFRAKIPVYNYNGISEAEKFSNLIILSVKSDVHYATFTGNHNVWQVIVFEDASQKTISYFIDKETGKFWKILYSNDDGDLNVFTNNESDYNPLKNKFDKEATLNLVTKGKSVIKGQAFARDNKNSLAVLGVKVLNTDKKQFADKGTKIILTPYTAYFEEWNKANEPKKNSLYTPPTLPLPKGAELCIIETNVIDDEGNFEFLNLMPGKYLITTTFEFNHLASKTTVIGYNEYFTNGYYTGSSAVTNTEHYDMSVNAKIKKIVEITKDGEIVTVKLKKSL
jgi:hypothetical protein